MTPEEEAYLMMLAGGGYQSPYSLGDYLPGMDWAQQENTGGFLPSMESDGLVDAGRQATLMKNINSLLADPMTAGLGGLDSFGADAFAPTVSWEPVDTSEFELFQRSLGGPDTIERFLAESIQETGSYYPALAALQGARMGRTELEGELPPEEFRRLQDLAGQIPLTGTTDYDGNLLYDWDRIARSGDELMRGFNNAPGIIDPATGELTLRSGIEITEDPATGEMMFARRTETPSPLAEHYRKQGFPLPTEEFQFEDFYAGDPAMLDEYAAADQDIQAIMDRIAQRTEYSDSLPEGPTDQAPRRRHDHVIDALAELFPATQPPLRRDGQVPAVEQWTPQLAAADLPRNDAGGFDMEQIAALPPEAQGQAEQDAFLAMILESGQQEQYEGGSFDAAPQEFGPPSPSAEWWSRETPAPVSLASAVESAGGGQRQGVPRTSADRADRAATAPPEQEALTRAMQQMVQSGFNPAQFAPQMVAEQARTRMDGLTPEQRQQVRARAQEMSRQRYGTSLSSPPTSEGGSDFDAARASNERANQRDQRRADSMGRAENLRRGYDTDYVRALASQIQARQRGDTPFTVAMRQRRQALGSAGYGG